MFTDLSMYLLQVPIINQHLVDAVHGSLIEGSIEIAIQMSILIGGG